MQFLGKDVIYSIFCILSNPNFTPRIALTTTLFVSASTLSQKIFVRASSINLQNLNIQTTLPNAFKRYHFYHLLIISVKKQRKPQSQKKKKKKKKIN